MDYIYAIQGLFAGIAVAVALYPVYRWFRDGWHEYCRLNGIITDARDRCEIKRGERMAPLPDFGRKENSHMYRYLRARGFI